VINIENTVNLLKERLDDVIQVDEYVFRGVKLYNNQPYAEYYVDLSGNIENRAEHISEFQDQIMGQQYFKNVENLKWNSYLLLLADRNLFSKSSFQHARSLLEEDRNYARKLVIPDDELTLRLESRKPLFKEVKSDSIDVLREWEDLLINVGLDDVLSDKDIAPIVRNISKSTKRQALPKRNETRQLDDGGIASSFLRHITIKKFRDYPKKNDFDFGTVNLIRGVNGVGKTTLLEAIEFIYCGKNKRSDLTGKASVSAIIDGIEHSFETTSSTANQKFRDRHLKWYGKLDLRRNLIHESFAKFNFLNTDAAVHLSTDSDPDQLQDDLATLLVGAEAARVWDRIGRVSRELKPEQRSYESQLKTVSEKIKIIEESIKTAKNAPRKSDDFFSTLREHLKEVKWRDIPKNKEKLANSEDVNLVSAESTISKLSNIPGLPAKLSVESIKNFLNKNLKLLDKTNGLIDEIRSLESERYEIERGIKIDKKNVENFKEFERYISSGFTNLVYSIEKEKTKNLNLISKISGIDSNKVITEEMMKSSQPISQFQENTKQRENDLRAALETTEKIFNAFKLEQDRAALLLQQLRASAKEILEYQDDKDICPLCNTKFKPGELYEHIFFDVSDAEAEERGQGILKEIDEARDKLTQVQKLVQKIDALIQYSDRCDFEIDTVHMKDVVAALKKSSRDLDESNGKIEQLKSNLNALESNGLDFEKYKMLRESIESDQLDLDDLNSIRAEIEHIDKHITQLMKGKEKLDKNFERLIINEKSLAEEAGLPLNSDSKIIANQLQKHIDNLELAERYLNKVNDKLLINESDSLSGLSSALQIAASVQNRLRQALELEKNADKTLSEATESLNLSIEEKEKVKSSLRKINEAQEILSKIITGYSLESATSQLLEANIGQVASIFSKIHSPNEFDVTLSKGKYLKCINSEELRDLKEISTGQRAAFALSIFLAMNAYADEAPPVMLIDDPVAHVDDLNTLSLLDYLRDVAVSGERQIFFATADDKLAGLFRHKFNFLGDEFKEYNLIRD